MMKKIVNISLLVSVLVLFGFAEPVGAEIDNAILRVDGLACPFCAYGLEKKVTKIKGVTSFHVNMKEGKVFVGFKPDEPLNLKLLNKAVKEAGFTLRSVSLRVKGRIEQPKEGLVLVARKSQEKFLLFENEVAFQKYHQGKLSKTLGENLEKKLIDIKEQGKEVLIEGVVHEHKGLTPGLSVENLEIIN